ncbi:MAG: hypothetical protein JO301_02715 [Chitinophagaceae bacterium]|nr:hypothetical protein [Chitinophagaceae bacterium]
MDQGKTILPDFLLADLYKQNLVIIEGEAKAAEIPAPKTSDEPLSQWWLGSNLQKITLIVNEAEAVYLRDESLNFLSAILEACKLNLGDVAIVNIASRPVDYGFLKTNLAPKTIVLFGIGAAQIRLPFTIPNYQVQQYDGCNLLLAPPLEAMLGSDKEAKLEKSKLWLCLKKMFGM